MCVNSGEIIGNVFSCNPNYTYMDVVKAIKNGGEDVAAPGNKTSTGKAEMPGASSVILINQQALQ